MTIIHILYIPCILKADFGLDAMRINAKRVLPY